jgi:flagellar hook-associated protein 2
VHREERNVTSAISGSGSNSTGAVATGPTATAVSGAGGVVTQTISGLSTGLDTGAIIAQLVAAQRANREGPINQQIANANASLLAYSQIQADATILQSAARALSAPTAWQALTAQSSNPNAVIVSAGIGSSTGNLSFSVDRLATAGSVRSTNIFNSGSAALAADSAILLATGGQTIGFSTFASDNALSIGAHAITVTQSSAAATKLGDSSLATSTIVDGTNDTIQLSIDGNPYTLTLAHGTYDATQLAAAVQSAATSAGAPLTAAVDSATGKLLLSTTEEGSAATLQVTGGNALAALNLSTDGSALTGVDGKVTVDGGPVQTFTSIAAGQALTLNAAVGTISATFSGGLRAGTVNTMNVSTGDGSLQTVVSAINVANVGVIASAVQVGVNQFRLQLTSATTGVLHDLNIAASELGAGAGGLVTVNQAADAQLTIGSGPGAFTVTSGSNVVSGLMAGVTLTLVGKTTDQVTVSTAHDSAGLADKIQALVDAANDLHSTIGQLTAYDPATKTAQPLTGDFAATQLSNALATALEDAIAGSALVSPTLVGVSADKTGTFKFDRSAFLAAYNANPSGVAKMFTQGGASANPDVTFISASDSTRGGAYSVNVTQLATQASSVGLNGTWPTGVTSSIGVKVGTNQISYQVKATDTQADVVTGLNAAFATAGLALEATVSTDGIKIASVGYGHNSKFDVAWDGTNFSTASGTDVAGTINGVTATGNGQQLLVPFATPGFGGLALNISGNTLGDLGTFTYSPGIAQRVSTSVDAATDAISGYITTAQNALHTQLQSFNDTIADMELQIASYQSLLQMQFTNMETIISTLKTTGDTLTNALSQLPKFSGNGN